ncbi:hypothetical protein BA953_15275 [Vibrio coralliilyticus]|uniref:winged helix-turn-helix domain-containing protein n=1 Tax=Vibrio coralliilyticus TaxID=190893 RepID=UPI000810C3E1|nr:transcriptional regulator [Vibrio coralliilyticus]ANW25452.1 hypothetical protein BA953_15275 [Vibrio coralliilyticus]
MIETSYKLGSDFIFYPRKNQLTHVNENTKDIFLGSNESRLLTYFLSNSDRTISRNELVKVLWEEREIFVDDSSLTQSVSTLRKALSDSSKLPMFIKTVPKKGYEFVASVEKVSGARSLESPDESSVKPLKPDVPMVSNNESIRGHSTPCLKQAHDLSMRVAVFTFLLVTVLILVL